MACQQGNNITVAGTLCCNIGVLLALHRLEDDADGPTLGGNLASVTWAGLLFLPHDTSNAS